MRIKEVTAIPKERIDELEQADIGRYDPSKDEIHTRNFDDTRKPKITLEDLNRLKKIRATRKLEQLKKQELLGLMYGQTGEEEGGGAEL